MSIGKAWCVEIDKNIDIVEAHAIYFGLINDFPHLEQKRLRFLCPTEACRNMSTPPPDIRGINYYEEVIEKGKQGRHFRLYDAEMHHPDCFIADREIALKELLNERKINESNECKIDQSAPDNIISIFEPATADQDYDDLGLSATVQNEINKLPTRELRVAAIKRALTTRPIRTGLLHKLVSQYEALGTWSAREKSPIRLSNQGPVQNYQTCFKLYKEHEIGDDDHIFHGLVSINEKDVVTNKKTIKGVVVEFLGNTTIEEEKYNGSFYFSYTKLEAYRFPSNMLKLIKHALSNKCNIYCYFYGYSFLKEIPHKEKPVLNIEIAHLSNLTFRKESPYKKK